MEDIEDTDFVASEHDILISAISKLDKNQHITEPTRSEPTNLNSEFNLIKRSNKLDLINVAKVLDDTARHVQIGKKLKNTQNVSKILPKPLEKPQAERIKRATGYDETKKKIGRWDPVVARSRTVDFISFPLKNVGGKPRNKQPTKEFLSKFIFKSPLEKELDEVDPPAVEEAEDEPEQTYPMTYEEMIIHRQQLAKLRALQSYKAAKAKRQSKIKSKKYHRILKKEKLKQQLKEFEELQKKNPEEALKKLEVLEKSRALERHTLRHKNTGKWAKNKLVRAKYDKEVRQQLAEQLSVGRSLTHKTQDNEITDDEENVNENIPDIALSQDPMNPWMMKRPDKSNIDAEFDFGYKKYVKGKMFKQQDDSDSDQDDSMNSKDDGPKYEFKILKENVRKVCEEQINDDADLEPEIIEAEAVTPSELNKNTEKKCKLIATSDWAVQALGQPTDDAVTKPEMNRKQKKNNLKQNRKLIAASDFTVEAVDFAGNINQNIPVKEITTAFDSYEDSVAKKIEQKLKKIRQNIEKLEKKSLFDNQGETKQKKERDNLEYLKLKNKKLKPIIDEQLIETGTKSIEEIKSDTKDISKLLNIEPGYLENTTDTDIDPNRFIEVKSKYLNTALPKDENGIDLLDDDEQVVPKVNIEEVFEEDDVVASFRHEKENEIKNDKLEDINLNLPGWGSWGGKGVKAPKRKRNRFILKAPPKVPRRDENKGDIIIKEYRDPKLAAHKVSHVPFPFTSVKDYEASIRAPLGNTFIPEKAHKQLIRPSVITRAGTIIEPMGEEELLDPKNRKFNNESVMKLLGQK